MPQYTENLQLYKPSRLDTDLAIDETLTQNFEKIDEFAKGIDEKFEEVSKKDDEKDFILNKASIQYLYDLEMANTTVNQSIYFNELAENIYATQVYNTPGDKQEGYIITRMTEAGKQISSMVLRNGGHGTSIALERFDSKIFIWSNLIKVDSNGDKQTQWLCRFPYLPGETITIDDSRVEKFLEFPNASKYMSPIGDMKNKLIAFRHTDSTGPSVVSRIEVHTLENLKAKVFNAPVYTFSFTETMNSGTLQGLALDGSDFYLTNGQSAVDFHLFKVDLKTGNIEQLKYEIGKAPNGRWIEDFGEPEGISLYTDPLTGYKTLFTVIVGDEAGRRRQRLYAFTNNPGINRFLGYALDRVQAFPLTRPDGKAKRIDVSKITKLSQIRDPGDYYMTTAEADSMSDHPMKGVAGWWLYVSGGDSGNGIDYGVHQTLVRNSVIIPTVIHRTVTSEGSTSPWFSFNMTQL